MKTLIIVCGHCGTTLKTAKMLSNKIGGADIVDTLQKNSKIDVTPYDNVVFGWNIRIFMLNFRFSKWQRKLRKSLKEKNVFGYLIGANPNNDKLLKRFAKKLLQNKGVVFAWGEFVTDGISGKMQKMYADMKADWLLKGKELPHVLEKELDKLALFINKAQ